MARDRQGEPERRDQASADLAWMDALGAAMDKLRSQGEALTKAHEQAGKSVEQEIAASRARIAARHKMLEAAPLASAVPEPEPVLGAATYTGLPDSPLYAKRKAEAEAKSVPAVPLPGALPMAVPVPQVPGANAPTAQRLPPVMMQLASGSTGAAAGVTKYSAAAASAAATNRALMAATQGVNGQLEKATRGGFAVAAAYAYASSRLLAFGRAGLAGTTLGERLSYTNQMLHRSIVSAFVPAIEAAISRMQQVTEWFRHLSGAQQASLARWTGLSVGMLGVLTLLPKLGAGLQTVGAVLAASVRANPFLVMAAGIAAVMSRTEEGRTTLKEIGTSLMEAFSAAADVLTSVLVPALDFLTSALSSPAGKVLLLTALFAAGAIKIIGAIRAIGAAASGMGGAISLGIGVAVAAIAAMAAAGSSSTRQFAKDMDDVIEQVKRGQLTVEDAKKEMRLRAFLQAEKEAEGEPTGAFGFGGAGGLAEAVEALKRQKIGERAEELGGAAEERLKRFLERGGGGKERSDLVSSNVKQTSPADLIRSIEQAALKTDTKVEEKRTADATEGILKMLQGLRDMFGKDNKEKPPKAD